VPATKPEVVVLDVRLPDGDGVELCRELRSGNEGLASLMLTSFDDDEALLNAVMAGATGYVLKQIRGTELIDAIRRVAAGESLMSQSVTRSAFERLRAGPVASSKDAEMPSLTAQERRILDLISEGCTNRQIAARMYLAEKTVKNYVSNLLRKLGMQGRTEAAVFATRIGNRSLR
jgi:two-component system, NarL family, response regulator DevR